MKRYNIDVGNKHLSVDVQDAGDGMHHVMVGNKSYTVRVSGGRSIEGDYGVPEIVPTPPQPISISNASDISGPILESIKALAERPQIEQKLMESIRALAERPQISPQIMEILGQYITRSVAMNESVMNALADRIINALLNLPATVVNVPAQPVDLNINVAGTTSVVTRDERGRLQSLESRPNVSVENKHDVKIGG